MIVALGLAALAALVVVVQPRGLIAFLERAFPRIVWRVATTEPLVALTFDDGPDAVYTPQVLDLLARYNAQATFFLIGERAAALPSIVDRIRIEGHEVGNHHWADRKVIFDTEADFLARLDETERAVGLGGAAPKLFRPPGGVIRPGQLTRVIDRGYTCVLGSAHPYDPARPPVPYQQWLVAKNLAPGAIVVLHDAGGDRSRTVLALRGILEDGAARGLRFVTVGRLLASRS